MKYSSASSGRMQLQLAPVTAARAKTPANSALLSGRGASSEFDVTGFEHLRGQWVWLTLLLELASDEWSAPALYFELDAQEPELHTIGLPCPTKDAPEIELIFNVPANFRSVRFRPNARPGHFKLGEASVLPIGRSRAIAEMLCSISAAHGISRAGLMLVNAVLPRSAVSKHEKRQQIVQGYMRAKLGQYTYAEWIRAFEENPARIVRSKASSGRRQDQPTISIVLPVFNIQEKFLRGAIDSVLQQTYPYWQLCIADDASTAPHIRKVLQQYANRDSRIQVVYRDRNGHIVEASNSALELATSDWVALLDHDDRLHPLALHFVAEASAAHPNVSLIYSDEDKIDEHDRRSEPYFKCDYNYELLLAYNMICHLTVMRRTLIAKLGGFRPGFEGAQDYDLVLRAIEHLSGDQILHLPRVLYHWRAHPGSTALSSQAKPYAAAAGRRAVAEHLARRQLRASVTPHPDLPQMNRVRFALPDPAPKVSIVICTRDRADLLAACVDSISERSSYTNYEVLIVDNGSVEEATFRLLERLPSDRFRVLRDESPFNFSALNNRAVRAALGELVCLLNNDTVVITADWIEEMLSFAVSPGVGAVGARLWYPSGGLQHGGVILGPVHVVHHAHRHLRRGELGYFGRAVIHQSFSAVTGAALMIRKSIYDEVGGLDETLPVTFNDIDFCLRVHNAGYRNVWTPFAEMIHHECATRGDDVSSEKRARVEQETAQMKQRWPQLLNRDPAYSPNLSIEAEDLRIAWPPRIDGYQDVIPAGIAIQARELTLERQQ